MTTALPLLIGSVLLVGTTAADPSPARQRPTVSEFLGLNTHTVQFQPPRYEGVVRHLRDYHPMGWDLGDDTAQLPPWPQAKNKVDWRRVYGSWVDAGFVPNVCLMESNVKPGDWKDLDRDTEAYARSFAEAFGPGGRWPLVPAVGIGNEPGGYSDEEYLRLFDAMSRGLRAGDGRLLITTCNVKAQPSGQYWKSADLFRDRLDSFDVITTHSYAMTEGWPTWRRTYPENPATPFLAEVRDLLAWRDRNAPGKQVWVNEFGWDASTKPATGEGTFGRWEDVSDEEQAIYLVRAALLFMSMGVDRAYVYFFDDRDEPKLHASSGITRHGEPKPAWHALRHLQRTLGDYRFDRVLDSEPGVHRLAFVHKDDPRRRAVVLWSTAEVAATPGFLRGAAGGTPVKSVEWLALTAEPPAPLAADATVADLRRPVFILVEEPSTGR